MAGFLDIHSESEFQTEIVFDNSLSELTHYKTSIFALRSDDLFSGPVESSLDVVLDDALLERMEDFLLGLSRIGAALETAPRFRESIPLIDISVADFVGATDGLASLFDWTDGLDDLVLESAATGIQPGAAALARSINERLAAAQLEGEPVPTIDVSVDMAQNQIAFDFELNVDVTRETPINLDPIADAHGTSISTKRA